MNRRAASATHQVVVERGALTNVGVRAAQAVPSAHRWAVVIDATVDALVGDVVRRSFAALPSWHVVPSGERYKTRETWSRVTDELLAARHGRDSAICAIGGGVTGDVAGFVAATFLRGIPVVQVPTTLLAMVDASVGGKTAVDVPAGKNLVGAFHPPAAVVIDPQVLDTLPLAERRAGFAEMLKAGVVADARWFDDLASHAATWMVDGVVPPALDDAIATAVRIKQEIVADDPTERGRRAVLNFGHTVAHAIEHATHYGVRHGDAVAIGMVIEAAVGERLGVSTGGSAARIRDACRAAGLPVTMPAGIDPTDVIEAMHTDKKARAGAVRCALPVRIGLMARAGERWTIEVRDDLWPDCLAI